MNTSGKSRVAEKQDTESWAGDGRWRKEGHLSGRFEFVVVV